MTIQIKILKNGVQTHGATSAQFENMEAFETWKQSCIDSNVWGKPERWVQDTPMSPLSAEEKTKAKANRKVKGPTGEDITEYQFEAEYTIDIKDITSEVKAEKDKKDKKDKDRKDRVTSLKAIDWTKIKNFNDALPILQALVNEQLKDEA